MGLNIPEGYEAFKMNCLANDDVATILCRRPDGGVSSLWRKMNRKATDGECPACGRTMKNSKRVGVMYCNNSAHIPIVMTNNKATVSHRRTAPSSRPKTKFIPKFKSNKNARKPMPTSAKADADIDIEAAVRKVMAEKIKGVNQ